MHAPLSSAISALRVFLATAALATAGRAQAQVWTLDDDAPADYSSLQAALSGAGDGDILLVKPGSYHGVPAPLGFLPAQLSGKSLAVVADAGGQVLLLDGLKVLNVPAGGSVYLRGLDFGGANLSRLEAVDAQGTLWVEDCWFLPSAPYPASSVPRVRLVRCAAAHLNRCDVNGFPAFEGLDGGDAVYAEESALSMYDTVAVASSTASLLSIPSGLRMYGGFAFVSGSFVEGGGPTIFGQPCGGPGIKLLGPAPQLVTLATTILAGGGASCGTPPVEIHSGTWTVLPGAARSLSATSPVREGQSVDLLAKGQPGDLVFVHVALGPGFFYDPFFAGVAQISLPLVTTLVLGTIGAGGQLSASIPIGPFVPALHGLVLPVQAAVLSSAFEIALTGGSVLVLLDSGIT